MVTRYPSVRSKWRRARRDCRARTQRAILRAPFALIARAQPNVTQAREINCLMPRARSSAPRLRIAKVSRFKAGHCDIACPPLPPLSLFTFFGSLIARSIHPSLPSFLSFCNIEHASVTERDCLVMCARHYPRLLFRCLDRSEKKTISSPSERSVCLVFLCRRHGQRLFLYE